MNVTKEVKTVSFEGQVFSVGMDVHKKSWSVTVVKNGIFLKRFSIQPDTSLLLSILRKKYPDGKFEFCYEAGFCGFWIQRELSKLGYKCIVINPADVPTTQKDKVTKSDSVDSRKLAHELSNNSLQPIYIPAVEEEAFRDVYRYRSSLIKKQTSIKNQIKSFLNKYGIESLTTKWSMKYISWLDKIVFPHEYSKLVLDSYIDVLDFISNKIKDITKKLKELLNRDSKQQKVFNILKSIPGVGDICALTLIAEIGNVDRFENDDQFCSYIGLIPMTKNSGDKNYSRGITFRHKNKLRCMLVESSWIAVREDPTMLIRFEELSKRMHKNKAIIRITKKLARRIRYLWKNKEVYVKAVA